MAVAGVVNIVTRRGADSDGEAVASAGNLGTTNLAFSKSFAVTPSLGVQLGVDEFRTAGYQQTPPESFWRFPQKQGTDARNTNFRWSMSYRPSAETSAYLRLGHHVQDQHIGYQYGRNLQKSPALAAGLSTGLGTWGRLDGSLWAQSVRFTKENGAS